MATDITGEDLDEFGEPSDHEDETSDDSPLENVAEVTCPYCGAVVTISIDPAGGSRQQYVEDCEVCCQPWNVLVQFDSWGIADVEVEQSY